MRLLSDGQLLVHFRQGFQMSRRHSELKHKQVASGRWAWNTFGTQTSRRRMQFYLGRQEQAKSEMSCCFLAEFAADDFRSLTVYPASEAIAMVGAVRLSLTKKNEALERGV